MPYIITEPCTKDGSCVEVCPVACIHTTPDAPQYYIDPDICIECEQCVVVCPVDAIFLHTDVPAHWQVYQEINASFFRKNKAVVGPVPMDAAWEMIAAAHAYAARGGLNVTAVVVDDAGTPIAVGRMDGALPRTAELAWNKAYTAVAFQVSTDETVALRREPWLRSLVVGSRGRIMAAAGGVPIMDGVTMVGAIGVAGGRDEQDHLCCRAGLATWERPVH